MRSSVRLLLIAALSVTGPAASRAQEPQEALEAAPFFLREGVVGEYITVTGWDSLGRYWFSFAWDSPELQDMPSTFHVEGPRFFALRCNTLCHRMSVDIITLEGTANDSLIEVELDGRLLRMTCKGELDKAFGIGQGWSQTGVLWNGEQSWGPIRDDPESGIVDSNPFHEHACDIEGADPESYQEQLGRHLRGSLRAWWAPGPAI